MIAIVPARGGSKGLPRKNILNLHGKPLIQYTLDAALKAENISRVIVSTDDKEIASIALSVAGVEIPFMRPKHLASDDASAIDVYLDVVEEIRKKEGVDVDELCVLLPTSPLRISEDIDRCIDLYKSLSADVVVSVQIAKPLEWHLNINETNNALQPMIDVNAKQAISNRQDLGTPPVVLNGSIYVLKIDALKKTRSYFGSRTHGYIMPSIRSVDIDNSDDFLIAEALIAASNSS